MVFQGYSFYTTILRLWIFIVLLMIIIAVMFPVRLPLCGQGGNTVGGKLSFRDFAPLLLSNAVAGSVIVRLRSWLLMLLIMVLGIVLVNYAIAFIFSIELRAK
jgi:hypothetical protein